MKRIAIFASGSGTNAQQIAEYFKSRPDVEITLILSNNPEAGVISRAARYHIPVVLFENGAFYKSDRILQLLLNQSIDLVVLAGFMKLIPADLVTAFSGRMVNIHPALLPKYGGKGMYGSFVHEAVIAEGERESGITIHLVNEHYDEGNILFQASCPVYENDSPEDLANRIHTLEHEHYPIIIDKLLNDIE